LSARNFSHWRRISISERLGAQQKNQLTRQVLDNEGKIQIETVQIPPNKLRFSDEHRRGTSGYDAGHSGAIPPDFAFNPNRLDRTIFGALPERRSSSGKKAEISNSRWKNVLGASARFEGEMTRQSWLF